MEIFQGFVFAKVIPSKTPSMADQFEPYLDEIKLYFIQIRFKLICHGGGLTWDYFSKDKTLKNLHFNRFQAMIFNI